jgi:hypothetical protein
LVYLLLKVISTNKRSRYFARTRVLISDSASPAIELPSYWVSRFVSSLEKLAAHRLSADGLMHPKFG